MSRSLLSLVLAAALLSTTACQQARESETAGAANAAATAEYTTTTAPDAPLDTAAPVAAAPSATPGATPGASSPATAPKADGAMLADADFVMKAASGGMMQVEAAKQAQHSNDATVKGVADMILKDYTKANDELKALAAKKDVKLPPGPIDEAKTTLDKLMAVSGKEFDRMYLDEMNMAHDKDIAMFDAKSKDAKDADIGAFAAKILPALRMHAEMIKKHQKMN